MPYDYKIENNGDHIRVEITGERIHGKEVEDLVRVLFQVIDFCRETGITRILAVSKLKGRFPAFASLNLHESLEKIGWDKSFRLANVVVDKESLEDIQFTETVSVNRGYRSKVFNNEQDAKAWLLEC
jgi:hypothetical protein